MTQSTLQNEDMASQNAPNNGCAMRLDYLRPSQIHGDHVALFAQLNRPEVAFHGTVKQPLLFRDCLLALFDTVSSDYRYVPKDRTAYTAFMQMKRTSANRGLFTAQRAYFDWLFNNDPLAYCILDPIVQVHQEGVTFEVFSKDEGCYAQLTFDKSLFETVGECVFGTTHIDYSSELLKGVEQIRSYRPTQLDIGHQAVELAVGSDDDKQQVIEKRINVPKTWIRSLLQVQSASTLSKDTFSLDPVALYNLLFELRMHADVKGKKRGLVIELAPNKYPTLMLEPFDTVVQSRASIYQGATAKVVRLWGRRRLALLKKVLPYTKTINVTLLGQGMPSYWHLSGEGFDLTFAMTGFSSANWSQALNFDLLLPKRPDSTGQSDELLSVISALQNQPSTLKQLTSATGIKAGELKTLLIQGGQQGLVRYDLANDRYYYRPLSDTPLDMSAFAYQTLAQKQAHEILDNPKAVKDLSINIIPTKGVDVSATIDVPKDARSYHAQIHINEEGTVGRAECSCPQFLQHRLTQGVCSHLIALRLAYASHDLSKDPKHRYHETRLFSKRQETGQAVGVANLEQVQITLNQTKVVIERTGRKAMRQQWIFNSPNHAKDAFLDHIAHIQATGFLENQVI